jgi:hypothetical protein
MMRLVENFSAYKKNIQELPLTEATVVDKDKVYETKKKFRVDISRFTENLNNRIYSVPLWKRVINEQKNLWEGSFALADHPADEGSFKDVMGVWSNLHINEKTQTVKADVTFVGPYGQKAIEILEAGGKIGFSSSGFGDLKEDGKTVDESTYQIERIADCVLNPSQQVYGTIQDAIEENVNTNLNDKEAIKEHVKMSANKQSKLEERKFRELIESYYTGIKVGSYSPDKKLEELNELLSYFDETSPKELKEKIEKEIEETNKEIKEAIVKATSLKETFGTNNPEEFKEGFSKLATETSLYERQVEDWKKLAENLQNTITELKSELDKRPTADKLEDSSLRARFVKERYREKEMNLVKELNEAKKALEQTKKIQTQVLKELSGKVTELKESEVINMELLFKNKELLKENASLKRSVLEEKDNLKRKVTELTALPEVKHTDPKTMFRGFSENKKVLNYYNDLEKQHGKNILPYKEKILTCKTVFEAMRVYNTALVEMSNSLYTYTSGDLKENKSRIEEATGTVITHSRVLNKPEGWE